jgi:hypothetical protein
MQKGIKMELLALFLHILAGTGILTSSRGGVSCTWRQVASHGLLSSLPIQACPSTELLKCVCLYICSKKIHMACCHLEDYFNLL